MAFVLPKCATSSVRSVPCELARTSAFRSMGWYSTAKAASANRIKNKAVRGMWKLFICSPLLWWFHLGQMPLGDEKAHGAGGKYHIIAGDAVEHQHAHHLAPFQKAAELQQKAVSIEPIPATLGRALETKSIRLVSSCTCQKPSGESPMNRMHR